MRNGDRRHLCESWGALQVPRLPRISCGTWWRWQTSCAFLYGKAHALSCRVPHGRKSGCARDDKGEGNATIEGIAKEGLTQYAALPLSSVWLAAEHGSAALPFVIPSVAEGSAERPGSHTKAFVQAGISGAPWARIEDNDRQLTACTPTNSFVVGFTALRAIRSAFSASACRWSITTLV